MEQKKDWTVNRDDSRRHATGIVTHVVPLNDDGIHWEDFQERGLPACRCACNPGVEFTEEPRLWVIIHNSYDGREGVEWAKELLK